MSLGSRVFEARKSRGWRWRAIPSRHSSQCRRLLWRALGQPLAGTIHPFSISPYRPTPFFHLFVWPPARRGAKPATETSFNRLFRLCRLFSTALREKPTSDILQKTHQGLFTPSLVSNPLFSCLFSSRRATDDFHLVRIQRKNHSPIRFGVPLDVRIGNVRIVGFVLSDAFMTRFMSGSFLSPIMNFRLERI